MALQELQGRFHPDPGHQLADLPRRRRRVGITRKGSAPATPSVVDQVRARADAIGGGVANLDEMPGVALELASKNRNPCSQTASYWALRPSMP